MNAILSTSRRRHTCGVRVLACSAAVVLLLCGCQRAVSSADTASPPATGAAADSKDKAKDAGTQSPAEEGSEGVTLKPEEVQRMGIATVEAQAITHAPQASGFGVVLGHETVAQAVADLRTAKATARQSRAAFERNKRLVGTPGAMPADAQETSERQAAVDRAAFELTLQRLSSTFGQNPPWKWDETNPQLLALASGRSKLVRVTFPLGALDEGDPSRVRLARLNAAWGGKGWHSEQVWRAPADATIPGRSFFTVLKDSQPAEGEHVLAWAPTGDPEPGVLIPAAAVVISAGKYWCYVEQKPDTFVRTQIDPNHPTDEGYFVKEGISSGDKIVTSAAGELLAREMNPSTGAEAD